MWTRVLACTLWKCSYLTNFNLQKLQLYTFQANTYLNIPMSYLHFKMGNWGTEELKNFAKVAQQLSGQPYMEFIQPDPGTDVQNCYSILPLSLGSKKLGTI